MTMWGLVARRRATAAFLYGLVLAFALVGVGLAQRGREVPQLEPGSVLTPLVLGPKGGTPGARVVEASGDVTVLRADGQLLSAVASGLVLHAHDVLRTGRNGRAVLEFPRRGRVRVEPGSELILGLGPEGLADPDPAPTLRLSVGEIWVHVLARLSRLFHFRVETPSVIAGVRGTIFRVRVSPRGDTKIQVYRGVVRVEGHDREVDLEEGQQIQIGPAGGMPGPQPIQPPLGEEREELGQWLEDESEWAVKTLEEMLAEVEERERRSPEGESPELEEAHREIRRALIEEEGARLREKPEEEPRVEPVPAPGHAEPSQEAGDGVVEERDGPSGDPPEQDEEGGEDHHGSQDGVGDEDDEESP